MVREIIIIFLIILTVINGNVVKNKKESANRANFLDSERAKYARLIASYIDNTVDPCDDFYRYACGNYFKIHKVKHGVSSTGVFDIVADEMNEALHEILSEAVDSDKQLVTDKAKLFYQSCMQVNIFNYHKSDTYLKLIESLGGWPALDRKWNPNNFDWWNSSLELESLGINGFFLIQIGYYNLTFNLVPFGIQYALNDNRHSEGYIVNKKLILKISNMYDLPKRTAKKLFKDMVYLDKEWDAFVNSLKGKQTDKESNKTLEELKEEVPGIDWDKFVEKLFGTEVDSSLQITAQFDILKELPKFFRKTNAKAVANYMVLLLLNGLHSEFYQPKYHKDFCLKKLNDIMPDVLTLMYLNSKHHLDSVEDEVMSMASYMRSALKDIIKQADWMDLETKQAALIKLRDMRMIVGDVELSLDLNTLNNEYEDLEIDANSNFYENNLNFLRFQTRQIYRKAIDDSAEPERYDSKVNAYYYPESNKMQLPAGILRRPFFIPGLPNAYNYAAMGANIIGHEMTHGFDSIGRDYDENGNEENWWSNESTEAFNERAECFVEQYDAYRIPEMNSTVQGDLTLSENIADSGGVRQGYLAYQKWLKVHEGLFDMSRETLPNLNMTNYQLFFVSYAQSYCSKYKRGRYIYLETNEHAADKFRVIGSVSNFDEFGKHFNCKLGTTMNPEKKCILW